MTGVSAVSQFDESIGELRARRDGRCSTNLPVSADLEGFGDAPEVVAETILWRPT